MKSIDFKSLLIGILGTALVMVLMGQSKIEKQYDVECVAFIDPKVVMDPTIENNWVQCRRFDLSKKMGRGEDDYQKWQWNNWIGGDQQIPQNTFLGGIEMGEVLKGKWT